MSTTIRNMSTNKHIGTQPVETKIISHCILVLKILYKGGTSKNQLFNKLKNDESKIPYKTDKSSTLEAIKHLRKSKLVNEISSPPTSKGKKKRKMKAQRIVVELTELGKELSQLIYYLDECELSYKELKNKINNHFADSTMNLKPVVLENRLRRKGWKHQEIKEYDRLIEGVLVLETHLPLVLFNTILSRYLKIIYSYPLNILAKEILKKVIIDSITKYILNRLEGILADQINSNNPAKYNAFFTTYRLLSSWMMTYIGNHVDSFSKNRFVQKESLELIKNMFHILNPEQNYLQNVLKRKAKTDSEISTFIQGLEASMTSSKDNRFKP
jgi:hypothetical protein